MTDYAMSYGRARQILEASAWEGDLQVIATKLSSAGRTLVKRVDLLEHENRMLREELSRLVSMPSETQVAINQAYPKEAQDG